MTSYPSLIPDCYRLESDLLSTQTTFTIDSTLLSTQVIDSISPSTRLYLRLCSEPMDFTYYSISRRDLSHGGERVELMIDG